MPDMQVNKSRLVDNGSFSKASDTHSPKPTPSELSINVILKQATDKPKGKEGSEDISKVKGLTPDSARKKAEQEYAARVARVSEDIVDPYKRFA